MPRLTALGILLAALLGGTFVLDAAPSDKADRPEPVAKTFPTVELEARAAYVYDVRTKTVLYAKNEREALPLASITKVMAALAASRLAAGESTVVIEPSALTADNSADLVVGERWRLKDLIDYSLVRSSNNGMHAVALSLGGPNRFVGQMNKLARELGLGETKFWNETGLDLGNGPGAVGSARDIAMLFEHIINHEPALLEATQVVEDKFVTLDKREHLARNTNVLAAAIPGLLASKTGYTDLAGGNLVVVFDLEIGRPVIVTILGADRESRFEDVERLVNAVVGYVNN